MVSGMLAELVDTDVDVQLADCISSVLDSEFEHLFKQLGKQFVNDFALAQEQFRQSHFCYKSCYQVFMAYAFTPLRKHT